MDALVGFTGFVGSNLASSHRFDALFNSSNIKDAFGLKPELLVYSGLRAEKFIANRYPEKDRAGVEEAFENMLRIAPSRAVLISTIDVYDDPKGADEESPINKDMLKPYGRNRLWLEEAVERSFKGCLVVRLPGLYGKNLKKNFIFDMMNRAPRLLTESKLDELEKLSYGIKSYYEPGDFGFFRLRALSSEQEQKLERALGAAGFSSLSFTDSRSTFQFYNLVRLWDHIVIALQNGLTKVNLATEPVRAGELYEHIYSSSFENILDAKPAEYDFRTLHNGIFGGSGGYIYDKTLIKDEIKEFVLGMVEK